MFFLLGLGYVEILRRINMDTFCQNYFDKIKVGTHTLNNLLPDKRHTKYDIRQETVYPLPLASN